jgi:hypothetical protein
MVLHDVSCSIWCVHYMFLYSDVHYEYYRAAEFATYLPNPFDTVYKYLPKNTMFWIKSRRVSFVVQKDFQVKVQLSIAGRERCTYIFRKYHASYVGCLWARRILMQNISENIYGTSTHTSPLLALVCLLISVWQTQGGLVCMSLRHMGSFTIN